MQRILLIGLFGCLFLGIVAGASQTEGGTGPQEACEQEACQPDNASSPMGTNLSPVKDWSSEYPIIDIFKLSRPWIAHDFANGQWDTREEADIDVDDDGWVRSLPSANSELNFRTVGTLIFTRMDKRYPEGEYTVLYDGEGVISYGRDANKIVSKSVLGRDVIAVSHTDSRGEGGIYIQIESTDPNGTGNYIRNIRILMPGFTEADLENNLFHPTFLQSIAPYKVLRFMDWMQTNYEYNSLSRRREPRDPLTEPLHPLEQLEYNPRLNQRDWEVDPLWGKRPEPSHARYSTDEGVPIEVMVSLSNQLDADPWFNMPHHASNFYVWSFAKMVHEQLESDRLVFLEYSNEVWNSGFGQAQWVEQQAVAKWGDSGRASHELRYMWYGMRSAEMCQIWKDTWGDDADRIKCVLGTQATNTYIAEAMLNCELYEKAPCDQYHDILAIAPYFGQHIGQTIYEPIVSQWAANPEEGLDKLFDELEHGNQLSPESDVFKGTLPNIIAQMIEYGELANQRGMNYIAYEGGQHLVGVGSTIANVPIADLFAEANRDPRMATIYARYLSEWHAAGGQIFTHYSSTSIYSQYGNWGAQEFYEQVDPVKDETIDKHIDETGCLWDICSGKVVYEVWIPIVISPEAER